MKITPQIILYLIILFTVFNYIFELFLQILNNQNRTAELPKELKDLYDDKKYKKQQEYDRENTILSLVNSSFFFIIILIILFENGFAYIYNISKDFSSNIILANLIFFGILGLFADILNIPFDIYSNFIIEEKYGFNKLTGKTYITDKIKSWLIGGIIGFVLLGGINWFYIKTTNNFWIYAWLLLTFFMLFFTMFYSSLIVPLFNKQKPLEDGDLREKIEDFAVKSGFKLDNIFVIDGSKRSTKANAYFSGIGPKKRIVLFDTLINDLSHDEIVAVLAHEIGHYKQKHIIKSIIISIINTGFMLFLFSLLVSVKEVSQSLGINSPNFAIGLVAFSLLFTPISLITGVLINIYSRKNEFEADQFATKFNLGEYLISSLKKLSVNQLSNLTPHPLYVFFHYSHPPLAERIKAINNIINSNKTQ